MAEKTFTCNVLTPERSVLETEASFAAIPAFDGEIGIMRDRAPLLCRLGIGVVRLETPEGDKKLFVDAGFAEVTDNTLTILTEQAARPDQVDVQAEEAALAEAQSRRAKTPQELQARRRQLTRSKAKLQLVAQSA